MRAFSQHHKEPPGWVIPPIYAAAAVSLGLTLPRLEFRLLPHLESGMTSSAAMAIYTAIGSGMLAMTGIVFSLMFVMVQFSSVAYSPRLISWIRKDRIIWHSLGVFTATFLYSIAATVWLDRNGSRRVPLISGWLVIVLLLASVAMFIALVQRITVLQISNMLTLTGDYGREVIETMYPPLNAPISRAKPEEVSKLPVTQILSHSGRPQAIQRIDELALLRLASEARGLVEVVSCIGDTVVDNTVLMRVRGTETKIEESTLRKTLVMGRERTFEQDPKYALRLLVDIAIRALSPAINDPTTAVQALDQIEDLLQRLGRKQLQVGAKRDASATLRLVIPGPDWEDFLILAFEEIRAYGAQSVQVMRRMKALTSDLISALPEERHELLRHYQARLEASIGRSFGDAEERQEAAVEDRQGLGVPRRIIS